MMIGITHVQQVIDEVVEGIGQQKTAFDDDSCLEIEIDGLPITMMYGTEPIEMLWLFADLGRVHDDPDVLQGILGLNLATWASGHMTLGLDSDGEHLVGYSSAPAARLTTELFKDQLRRLITGATDVVDRIAHLDFDYGQFDRTAGQETKWTAG